MCVFFNILYNVFSKNKTEMQSECLLHFTFQAIFFSFINVIKYNNINITYSLLIGEKKKDLKFHL